VTSIRIYDKGVVELPGNRSVRRSIEILDYISRHSKGVSQKEIIQELELPRTSAYDIIRELVDTKMIVEERGEVTKYKVGLKAFQIGNEYLNDTDLITLSKPLIKDMAEQINKTAFIAVMDQGFVTYLYKYEPKTSIITTSNIGTKNPIHCTSLGKAMLSGMEMDEIKEHLKYASYEPRTKRTYTNETDLIENLMVAKELGYAVDDREIEDHTLCIGSPIYNHDGKVIAGLSVSGFYSEDRDVEYEGNVIKATANEISKRLGYRR
jgi:DNA-binding IclR family transcriptional regulator